MVDRRPELMTLEEVADELRVSRKTLLNWRAQGFGPMGFRVGRAVRYRRDAVAKWLNEQEALEPQGAA